MMAILLAASDAFALTGSGVSLSDGALTAIDTQVYTSGTNTWTKPDLATRVHVWCVGSGGGGGSGARNGNLTSGGGGGGSSGAYNEATFDADELGSTMTAVIGAKGTGGTAVSSSATAGNPEIGRAHV